MELTVCEPWENVMINVFHSSAFTKNYYNI
uniref:Uncharacterized protein n=1 Tax=Anguilla anguilla TaxID=7936 RepID=A0A0E9RNH8_ANGAN